MSDARVECPHCNKRVHYYRSNVEGGSVIVCWHYDANSVKCKGSGMPVWEAQRMNSVQDNREADRVNAAYNLVSTTSVIVDGNWPHGIPDHLCEAHDTAIKTILRMLLNREPTTDEIGQVAEGCVTGK